MRNGTGGAAIVGATVKALAEYLDNEEVIVEYLSVSLEDPNPDVFVNALATVARAKGMTQLAKDTGLGRESLYKTLAPGAKPRFETIMKISQALGVPLGIRNPALMLAELKESDPVYSSTKNFAGIFVGIQKFMIHFY